MNFHQLHIFDTVAKHLSFAKASKKLYLSQPTLSVHMQKFEKTLQAKLFEQIGNRIYLTEAGKILFEYTQEIFPLAEEAAQVMQEFKSMRAGKIRLGVSSAWGLHYLPELLSCFEREYLENQLVLEIVSPMEIENKLIFNQLDIAILCDVSSYHETLIYEDLYSEPFKLAISTKNSLVDKEKLTLDFLKNEKFLFPQFDPGSKTTLEALFHLKKLDLKSAMEYPSQEGILNAVAANLGVSLVTDSMIKPYLESGQVIVKNFPCAPIYLDYKLVYHKDKYRTPLTDYMTRSVRNFFKNVTVGLETRVV